MKRLSIDPQIKSAHSGYWEQVIRILSIQNKSSTLKITILSVPVKLSVPEPEINKLLGVGKLKTESYFS